jgi:NAD(P)-dependent dehydrogenase (short-subunit alcohol dehydrogenase family)/acetyltransferase-like isoleucine patch superfamily enzyme
MYSINELKNLGVHVKGQNILISKFVNIYNPSNLTLHDNIRIDDFTILSCKGKIEIYDYVRISSHCLITSETTIIIHQYSNISSGVKIFGGMNNTTHTITNPLIPSKYSTMEIGDVIINKYCIIGSNAIIYPNCCLNEGTTIQPLTVANINTEPWTIYNGSPIKIIGKKQITSQLLNNISNEIFFNDLYTDELRYMQKESLIENNNSNTTTAVESNEESTTKLIPLDNIYAQKSSQIQPSTKLNILITGGATGIGRSIAVNFIKDGHNVIITYNKSYNEAIELNKTGAFIYELNITDTDMCKQVLQNIITDFTKIDVLINNAGVLQNGLFHQMSYENWHNVINTNLISIYNITHPVINNMLEYNNGKIINISSISGLKGSKGQSNYCASKFGIIGFTKTLALEYGRKNILTNCICPGLVNTDMLNEIDNKVVDKILDSIPVNKLIDPDEIFNICKLIINSKNCNGSIFNIDGGMLS